MTPQEALDRIAALCDEQDVGWVEFIADDAASTRIAYVHEGGSVYLPEGDVGEVDFRLSTAARRTHRLVRADEVRAVLAEVSPEPGGDPYCGRPSGGERCGVCGSRQSCYPEPGGVLDRDQARKVREHLRQAILAMLHDQAGSHYVVPSDELVDIYAEQFEAITARVRPVEAES